ncbi:TBC1 domain family member 1 [Galemys pyrenaicus]|uniref:TBC1 domain family member 1 n=1 Tax=Galemys pyrenaicus TaxID=202257 RepID=A0A8J6AGW3_GALPY|nr:TBC1 domain family member 1 [Galemys pyrenaicus]
MGSGQDHQRHLTGQEDRQVQKSSNSISLMTHLPRSLQCSSVTERRGSQKVPPALINRCIKKCKMQQENLGYVPWTLRIFRVEAFKLQCSRGLKPQRSCVRAAACKACTDSVNTEGQNSSTTKPELQKHLTISEIEAQELTAREWTEKQNVHIHTGEIKQTSQIKEYWNTLINTNKELDVYEQTLPISESFFRLQAPLRTCPVTQSHPEEESTHSYPRIQEVHTYPEPFPQGISGAPGPGSRLFQGLTEEKFSQRQQIFLQVAIPSKVNNSPSRYEDYSQLGEVPQSPLEPVCEDGHFGPILPCRMEKENQKLQASENDLLNQETIVDFIKNTLPNLSLVQMEKTVSQVFKMNTSKQCKLMEYHILHELVPLFFVQPKIETTKEKTSKQNFDLPEQVQMVDSKVSKPQLKSS